MPNTIKENDLWLDERAREVRASIEQLKTLDRELQYLQLGWRPSDGGWSIAQVIEHLILTDEPYVDIIPNLLPKAKRGDATWKPTIMGGFITRAVDPQSTGKVKARKGFQPGPEPRAHGIRDYIAIRERLLPIIEQLKGYDLNSIRMRSPVMGLIRYNVGDALMILTKHTQRHLQQIDRIRKNTEFPAPIPSP